MELVRLRDWHDKKSSAYSTSVAAWKRFRDAYNKRQKKHEEVRDNVNKELNSQFNRCAHESLPDSMASKRTFHCLDCSLGKEDKILKIRCVWS